VPSTNPVITAAPPSGEPLETATISMPSVTPQGMRMVAAPSSGALRGARLGVSHPDCRRRSSLIAYVMTATPAATSSSARACGGRLTAEPARPSSAPAAA
jgi:hypothetical protein